jgi:hypothetical protein
MSNSKKSMSSKSPVEFAQEVGSYCGRLGGTTLLDHLCDQYPPSAQSAEFFEAFWEGVRETLDGATQTKVLHSICQRIGSRDFLISPAAAPVVIRAHRMAIFSNFCCLPLSRTPTDDELKQIWDSLMGYFNYIHLRWVMLHLVPLGSRPGWSREDYLLRMLSLVIKKSVEKRAAYQIFACSFGESTESLVRIYRALTTLEFPPAPLSKLKDLRCQGAGQDGVTEFSRFVAWLENAGTPLEWPSSAAPVVESELKLS